MPWLKTVGCECTECGPDPCTPGCFCELSPNDLIQIGADDHYDVSACTPVDRELSVSVYNYADCGSGGSPAYYYQIEIYADASLIYDSGCITGNLSATAVTMPAGTLDLNIVVTPYCSGSACTSGGNGSWEVVIP
jgi:hypothetical protein